MNYNSIQEIIGALTYNEIGNRNTYVGVNYSKANLVYDLYKLLPTIMNKDIKKQMSNEVNHAAVKKKRCVHIPNPKRRAARQALLTDLIERDGMECFYCDKTLYRFQMTIEHIQAKSKGGTNEFSNLAIACKECNAKVGDMAAEEKLKLPKLV